MQFTCKRVNWADKEVASVCKVWTFCSSSAMYRIFLSFDLAADCLFAQILTHGNQGENIKHNDDVKVKGKTRYTIIYLNSIMGK